MYAGSSHHDSAFGNPLAGRIGHECDPEVRDHRLALVEHDVLGLHISMDHVPFVRVVQRRGNLARDRDRLIDRELLLALHLLAQRFARDVRHHVKQKTIRVPGIVEGQDVRMIQPRGDLDLAQEAIRAEHQCQLGAKHLDRYLAVVLHIVRQIYGRHASAAELSHEAIAVGECDLETREAVWHLKLLLRVTAIKHSTTACS